MLFHLGMARPSRCPEYSTLPPPTLLEGDSGVQVIPGARLRDPSKVGLGIVYEAWFTLCQESCIVTGLLGCLWEPKNQTRGREIVQ